MAKTFSLRGLLFIVALALLFFMGGLVNAVKVKAQDPAPAYKTAVQIANTEASLTLKAVNEKIQDAYSVKQENKNFKVTDRFTALNLFLLDNKQLTINSESIYINRGEYLGVSNEKSNKIKYSNKVFPIYKNDARRIEGLGIHTAKVLRD